MFCVVSAIGYLLRGAVQVHYRVVYHGLGVDVKGFFSAGGVDWSLIIILLFTLGAVPGAQGLWARGPGM